MVVYFVGRQIGGRKIDMYLKFVSRADTVPHRSFMIECDSFYEEQVTVKQGETLERYSPSIAQTSFPFEDDSWDTNTKRADYDVQVLIVNVAGAPGYKYIAGKDMILFVMNNEGKTIDKTVV